MNATDAITRLRDLASTFKRAAINAPNHAAAAAYTSLARTIDACAEQLATDIRADRTLLMELVERLGGTVTVTDHAAVAARARTHKLVPTFTGTVLTLTLTELREPNPERCGARSSVTNARCTLHVGHEPYSPPMRFHHFEQPAPETAAADTEPPPPPPSDVAMSSAGQVTITPSRELTACEVAIEAVRTLREYGPCTNPSRLPFLVASYAHVIGRNALLSTVATFEALAAIGDSISGGADVSATLDRAIALLERRHEEEKRAEVGR